MNTELQKSQPSFNYLNKEDFENLERACKSLVSSDLVPNMYKTSKDNPESKAIANCMIALDIANRMGSNPLIVMQNLIIVQGRPSWYAKFLISLVNTSGKFDRMQFKKVNKGEIIHNGKKIQNIECIAFATDKKSEKVLESSPISMQTAIDEGWYDKSGSKWKTIPEQMLVYRAASFWVSIHAPELTWGIPTDEEVADVLDIEYKDVSEKVSEEISEKANSVDFMAGPLEPDAKIELLQEETVLIKEEPKKIAPF